MPEHVGIGPVFPSRRATLVALIAFCVTCTSGEEDPQARDLPVGTPISIAAQAKLSVGVVEGDTIQEFDRVVTPFLLPDGRLVVPVAGASAIRMFDEQGDLVASFGRAGAGPGEFRSLTAAWSRGDTIEALDSRLGRITRFLPGGLVEVVALRSEVRDLSGVAGPVADGWIAGGVAAGDVGRRDSVVLHWFDRSGADRGAVGTTEGYARYRTPFLTGPEPLSPRAVLQVGLDRAYVAESLTPRIRVLTPAGTLEREILWQAEPPGSSPDVFRVVVDTAVRRTQPDRAAALRRHLEAAVTPDRLSVFWKFIVDDHGFIWIRPFEPLQHAAALGGLSLAGGGPGGRWSVLSPEGDPLGTVDVPAGLEILQITSNRVVGIARDAQGVEFVRVHALERR